MASNASPFELTMSDTSRQVASNGGKQGSEAKSSVFDHVREWANVASASGAYSDETRGELEALRDEEVHDRVAGNTVLLLIHGFNTPFSSVCQAYDDIRARFHSFVPEAYDRIVGFTWPGGDASYHYFGAKQRLQPSARALRRWIRVLTRHGEAVDVLAHSLGGRLLHQALQNADSPDSVHIRNLFAVAPAVRLSDVEADAESKPVFERGFLFYTHDDRVLGRWFRLFEGETAIGYAGPNKHPAVSPPAPVTAVNCSGVVDNHVSYLEQEPFYRYIADVLKTAPSRLPSTPAVRWDVLHDAGEKQEVMPPTDGLATCETPG